MKQFKLAEATEPITFKVDKDEFEAIPANRLPVGTLAKYFEKVTEGDLFGAHLGLFETALTEESYKLFMDRMNSKENPINVSLMAEISTWLLGDIYMGGKASDSDGSSGTGR